MRVQLDATVDAATRDLVQAWTGAWEEIADEWAAALDELRVAGIDAQGGDPGAAHVTEADNRGGPSEHGGSGWVRLADSLGEVGLDLAETRILGAHRDHRTGVSADTPSSHP